MRCAISEQSRVVWGHPPSEILHRQRCNLVHLFGIVKAIYYGRLPNTAIFCSI